MPSGVQVGFDLLVRFWTEVGDDDAPFVVGLGEQVLDQTQTNAGATAFETASTSI